MNEPEYIIAIGASAGGLDEINSFFDHTPLDGVSYIIVQHLSASFKSRMVEVLAKHSKLVVEEATDGKLVECNQVYLIPHDKYMTIENNRLYLRDKEEAKGAHLTINIFFNSLAADCGRKAIGIILSGLGSDGSEGLVAIKNAGGMIMARNPETSAFPSMPSKAIATGMVDFVLEPAAMPGAIEDYVKHEGILQAESYNDEVSLKAIVELIRQQSPLDFSDYKSSTILRRTKRRAAYHDFTSLTKYLAFLKSSPEEIEALSKDFLISVTSFFRDKEAFDYIRHNILPGILKKLKPKEELKIWVAGCATGEEVYSLAILIAEQLTGELEHIIVKIFATDIDSTALVHAGKGVYPNDIVKDVSAERLKKYFLKEGNHYRIKPKLRKMAIFAQHDLVKNPPYCNMHFISCRNLLIYMAPVLQKKIFSMLLFGLKMDGYLFLGSSENPMSIIQNLEVVNKQYKLFRNIKSKRIVSFDAFSMPDSVEVRNKSTYTSNEQVTNDPLQSLAETMHTNLADEQDYLVVCVDENKEVIKSYGDTSKYLLPKHFTSNLEKLLPKKLAMVFNMLSNSVLKTNQIARLNGIKIKMADSFVHVNLVVSPLVSKRKEQKLLMVTFTAGKLAKSSKREIQGFDEDVFQDQYTLDLEQELKEIKEKLSSAYEQLDASNENMQSFNEEMISANEEMQSTNEEMQSVNEELDTINSEYQLKNKELLEVNDDLNNYFRSNVNGQLFINNDLLLMKFSPGTVKQINLLETDIGRPLNHITTNIKFETLIEDVKNVLSKGNVITKEIETNNGKWYQVMTMPYVRQSDQKNSGAIITFNDITELKKTQLELDINNKMLGMSIDSAELGTFSIHVGTRAFQPSVHFKEIFGFYSEQVLSYEAVVERIEEEHRDKFINAIEASLNGGDKCDLEFPFRNFHDNQLHWVRILGNLSYNNEKKPEYFTGVLNDITAHKQDELRKNDFIAMVSHDLRTPLTSIQAYMQLITLKVKKVEDTFINTSLGRVNAAVKKMNTMINGFLTVSGSEEGQIHLELETFEMNILINEIVEESRFINSGIQIAFVEGAELSLKADRDKIGQVLNNFLNNAIKYSNDEKLIEVSSIEFNGMAQVCVKDKGIGIKLQDQEKLFDRYYRIKRLDTKSIPGFGLGLYLSAEIIKRHNGKVWVESEINNGSSFYFSLPLAYISSVD
ncbi:chemotaxis protein CheB [Pedobacter cryoconitis]|uniref:histidine kinase n=1 Tax=Pedobacter cryoconitis TaxID=188932 RepID=A0A327S0G3_9SPHI|nr:chemotaxis protein CheB [Pedobacter cryoconitis]RAJ22600.1 two-component system CheB/CheR fusion protein [Pedobacter cryoconitis]